MIPWALLCLLMLSVSGVAQEDFTPFRKSLQGLEDLNYVKEAVRQQSHRGSISRISSSQAVRSIRTASPVIGFEYTDRVQAILDFYTSQEVRKGVEIMLGLAETYLPLFKEVLTEEQMPVDLMYLPLALSSLNVKAVSDWGASGLWQIMFTNGKLYNLQIDSYVDERRDPVLSTRAALQYLKDLYGIYLDWELAIAAYSSSPSSINKAIRKAGGSKKYTDLYPFLPVETRDYLPAFSACCILLIHYEQTGLKPYAIEVPNYRNKEPVTRRLHLGQVAEMLEIPLPLLQDMNPEYKNSIIPATGKVFYIKLPSEKIAAFRLFADTIYSFKDSIYFPVKKNLVVNDMAQTSQDVNGKMAQVQSNVQINPQNKSKLTYMVKEGDNLGYISGLYNVTVTQIKHWNNLRNDIIRVGQVLDIWVPESKANQLKEIDGKTHIQKQPASAATGTSSQSAQTDRSSSASTGFSWYTVKSGDNLTSIASKYSGITADDILKLNKIKDPRKLRPGQKIKIPKK